MVEGGKFAYNRINTVTGENTVYGSNPNKKY